MADDFIKLEQDEQFGGGAVLTDDVFSSPVIPDFSVTGFSGNVGADELIEPYNDEPADFYEDDEHHAPSPFDMTGEPGDFAESVGGFIVDAHRNENEPFFSSGLPASVLWPESAGFDEDFELGHIPMARLASAAVMDSEAYDPEPMPGIPNIFMDESRLPSAGLAHIFDEPAASGSDAETAEELAAKEAVILDEIKGQMSWYGKKCRLYKKADTVTQLMMLLITGSIPVITAFDFESNKYIIILISAFLVFLEGVRNLMKYKEKWFIYRDTLETLKKEKLMYGIGVGPYDTPGKLKVLGRRYIEAISTENQGWRQEVSQPEQGGGR
ncbi:hypothetical protein C4J81_05640 [Deltaproteobacteria bacterium Smac51]|nr:hypothetical protein C4J81_05640 [Deltaproteobacteria bacterium Smac51]